MLKRCFYFLLCIRISSAINLISKNETLFSNNIDNFLEKFFEDLKTAYLQKEPGPRHVTIVTADENDFQQAEPLFKSHPYIVCRETLKCAYPEWFSSGNFVVVFLHDMNKNTFQMNTKLLSRCKKCRVLFISNNIRVDEVRSIFTSATEQNIQFIEFAYITKNGIKLYNNVISKNCTTEVKLVTIWRPGIALDKIHTSAFKLTKNFNGCPISVSSLNFKPKMLIEEKSNGSLMIVGGREGNMLVAIAEALNFTLNLRYPSIVDRRKFSRKMSIVNDVISGMVEIGIGRLLPTNVIHQNLSFSIPYDTECVTWGVPLIMNWLNDIVWLEFSSQVWILVGLVFFLFCMIGYTDQELSSSTKKGDKRRLGLVRIVLEMFAVDLGNPAVYISSSAAGKFILLIYLYYGMVTTTAYKSHLSAILATNKGTPMFKDVEEILRSNIMVGGSLYDYNILKDQVNDSELTSQLFHRFIVNNDDTENMYQLKYNQNYAFLARLSSLNYQKLLTIRDNESITFDTLDGCVLTYPTVIVFKRTSLIRLQADQIIRRLSESGLLEHWDRDEIIYTEKILEDKRSELYYENHTVQKMWSIFILYSSCISLCLLVFFMEITFSMALKKKQGKNHLVNNYSENFIIENGWKI